MKIVSFVLIALLTAAVAFAQQKQKTESAQPKTPVSDSAEFAKTFKEFYPLIKPKQSVKEQANDYYARSARGFGGMDLDSAATYQMAMKNLDTNADEDIYFDVYRKNLSAKELRAYMTFLKTPEGKRIVEVMPNLDRARSEVTRYISKTINANLSPIRTAIQEKKRKEMSPRDSTRLPKRGMMRENEITPESK
jgi:hypothetical protein